MEKVYTERKYLNRKVKCLEDGMIFNDIKEMCNIIYGPWFREYNKVGKSITNITRIRGCHYMFI